MTATSIEQTIAALGRMTAAQLRDKYLEVFGEPSRSGNHDFLFKRLAWRLQADAEGGLSERAKRRAEELARDADLRTTLPRPKAVAGGQTVALAITCSAVGSGGGAPAHARLPVAGTVLTRLYRGRRVEVRVLPDGSFEHEGQAYRSLSAVAKAVTGT